MTFAINLRQLRKEHNMSQEELADRLGYKSFTTIQKWESGVSEPSMEKVKAIAEIFGVTIEQLVNGSVEERVTVLPKILPSTHAKAPTLALDEQCLVDIYRELNQDGKTALVEYAELISSSDKYKKALSSEPDCG